MNKEEKPGEGNERNIVFHQGGIALAHDFFNTKNYPNTYYSPKKPLDPKKISPSGG
jgi:hypothetical protein